MILITGSVFSLIGLSGTFLVICITTMVLTTITTPLTGNGGELQYPDCRSTDSLSSPWITRLLFTLLQLSSSTRYLIALLSWLWPIFFIFLLPVAFVAFLYVTSLILQLYIIRHWLLRQLTASFAISSSRGVPTELLQRLLAAVWNAHGRIFHDYEICGAERLPKQGPVFLVYYHGTLPLDVYYLIARYQMEGNRVPIPIVDRFLFRMPGIQRILELVGAVEGSVEECTEMLTRCRAAANKVETNGNPCSDSIPGEIVILSPGGVREALFADEYYSVLWGKRRGFARVAIRSKQPIYPVFTENIREAIRVVQYGKSWWRRLYELTRLPFAIFYGYFPVKLRTYIGDPIYPRESETDEELADRVKLAIEEMIARYQWLPGSVVIALLQRFCWFDNWVRSKNEKHYAARK